ncbi:hypothetical protein AAE478_001269 [Parahypoxylon ruwenzoriense]
MTAIPLILCGQFEEMGKVFKEAVQPDFEVVYFTDSLTGGLVDIPLVLKGEIPTSASSTTPKVGTGNLVHGIPRAIVVGAPYDDGWIAALGKELSDAGIKPVPVLKPEARPGQAHGHAVVKMEPGAVDVKKSAERAVKVLKKLEEEGKLEDGEGGVFVY